MSFSHAWRLIVGPIRVSWTTRGACVAANGGVASEGTEAAGSMACSGAGAVSMANVSAT